jgi:hypothetical protein
MSLSNSAEPIVVNSSGFPLAQDTEIPIARNNPQIAYDAQNDLLIIHGGWKEPTPYELSDTWSYDVDNNTFQRLSSGPPRETSYMSYDSQSDKMVMFSGIETYGGPFPQDTWIFDYDANNWTEVTTGTAPPIRNHHATAYDIESDRTILFGGRVGSNYHNDTWAFDVDTNTWEEMSPAIAPGAGSSYTMTYDIESDRVIAFDRHNGGGTWAYDYNSDAWENLEPVTLPPLRSAHAMSYDNESDRVVMFGGKASDGGSLLGDTWLFDYNTNTWTNQSPTVAPSARSRHMMEYDSESDLIIIVGGQEGAHNNGDILLDSAVWSYDVNLNNWTEMSHLLAPLVTSPPTPTSTTPSTSPAPTVFPIELIAIAGGLAVVIILVVVVKMRR